MSTGLGGALVAYAQILAARAKGYGLRELNGKPQRGPDYFDCIGFVRDCLLNVAPGLWPSNRGGEDSWTVPNFLYWWKALKLGAVMAYNTPTIAGDILIFGKCEHIGIADGAGNCISALNPELGCRSVPIDKVGLPVAAVLRAAELTYAPAPTPPPPAPSPAPKTHVVQPGETLGAIARAYGVSLADLVSLNVARYPSLAVNRNLIRRGWILTIA
jgi:LysM repeat protein